MGNQLLSFVIPGRLKGKARARSTFKQARPYPDKATVVAESMVANFGYAAMKGRSPFDGPLIVKIDIVLNHPKSWSRKKKASIREITGKPDLDNIAKLIGDALNGIVWRDDAQICDLHIRRFYSDALAEQASIVVSAPISFVQPAEYDPRQIAMFEESAA